MPQERARRTFWEGAEAGYFFPVFCFSSFTAAVPLFLLLLLILLFRLLSCFLPSNFSRSLFAQWKGEEDEVEEGILTVDYKRKALREKGIQ